MIRSLLRKIVVYGWNYASRSVMSIAPILFHQYFEHFQMGDFGLLPADHFAITEGRAEVFGNPEFDPFTFQRHNWLAGPNKNRRLVIWRS